MDDDGLGKLHGCLVGLEKEESTAQAVNEFVEGSEMKNRSTFVMVSNVMVSNA